MTLIFATGLAFLFTHELDAMRAREWRMLPGLSRLADDAGREAFVALHVPLFAAILFALWSDRALAVRVGLDAFMVAHVVVHLAFHRHAHNGFRRWASWCWIAGAGLLGALDLALWLVAAR